MTWILLIVIGVISGIISGMGIGGGTILIPALSIFFGYEQQMAQNINLMYFIPTAVMALFTHFKNDNIAKKEGLRIVVFGIIGAVIGAYAATSLDSGVLRKIFGCFLLVMGLFEFFKKDKNIIPSRRKE